MKKIICLMILTCLLLPCLISCSRRYVQNAWYSDEKCAECFVPGLPSPEGRNVVRESDESIYVFLNNSEYESYVSIVYEYLKAQNLAYLGTRGEQQNTLAGVFTTYYFRPAESLEDFRCDYDGMDYLFIFSDGSKDENGDLIFSVLLFYYDDTKTLEYNGKKHKYNLRIVLRKGSEAPLGGFYVLESDATTES